MALGAKSRGTQPAWLIFWRPGIHKSDSCWDTSVGNKWHVHKILFSPALTMWWLQYCSGSDISQLLQLMTSDELQVQSRVSHLCLSHWPRLTSPRPRCQRDGFPRQKQTSHRNLLQHHLLMLLWSPRQTHCACIFSRAHRTEVVCSPRGVETRRPEKGQEKNQQISCHI